MSEQTAITGVAALDRQALSFAAFLMQYDGQHAEWLPSGEVSVQVANNAKHQQLLIFLVNLLSTYLSTKPIGTLMLAGFSMYLGDDQPAREPDLMVILNEHADRITPTYLNGAADIAIELVSPESVERDYGAKFVEYEAAGVREYWLIDPLRAHADFYVRTAAGLYHRQPLDQDGRLTSVVLPLFSLDPALLWRDAYPAGAMLLRLVADMVKID